MKITGKTRRMDSMMIDANIRKHYAIPNDFNQVFYYAKSSSYAERCLTLLNDADTLISTKIRGVGFALACNALKELGYLDYPKPDSIWYYHGDIWK